MKQLQKIIPPVYLLLSLLLMGLLHYFLPIMRIVPDWFYYAGVVLLLAGLATMIGCTRMFRKAETPVKPFERSTVLLTSGIYGYTRNPVYLGMLSMLLGFALMLGTLTPFLVPPVFFFIISEGFVRYEEPFLEEIFGDGYRQYKLQVRRWL